jgi:hypothetical protein
LLRVGMLGVAKELVLAERVERGILAAVRDSGIRQHGPVRGANAG